MHSADQSPRTDLELVHDLRATGDAGAREVLIMRHSGLARAIARRYGRRGLQFDDVLQAGYLGLILAVDRYDPSRGVPLERYAARTIEGEIMHLFRDSGWAIRVPRGLQELSRRVSVTSEQLGHELGRTPELSEVAAAVERPLEEVEDAIEAGRAYRAESLDEHQESPAAAGFGVDFSDVENRDLVERALRALPARERRMIEFRFRDGLTQSQIAERIGISQMHVSRLLRASLERLRVALEDAA